MKKIALGILTAVSLTFIAGTVFAQEPAIRLEAHGGIGLPTFDIADAAEIGPLFGAGVWYLPTDAKWTVGVETDFGLHSGADIDSASVSVSGPDVNVYHFMAKAGYNFYTSPDGKLQLVVNGGAGAVMFDVDVEGADSETYLAINAGGKLYYALAPTVDFVVSLQGDISFTDEDVLGTDNAWVWPLSVGIAFKL